MAGEGSFHTNGSGFVIPHFTDHDHIRVSPQKRPHHPGKIKPDLGLALHLSKTGLCNFHRIFGRPYFDAGFVDIPQRGVQGRCFPGAGGTHHQNQPVWLFDDLFHDVEIPLVHSHVVQGHGPGLGEYSQNGILKATGCGEGRQAQLEGFEPLSFEFNLSVLGQAPFRNIQIAHDL